jgi:membrane fusion protein (multidrug efflux system)
VETIMKGNLETLRAIVLAAPLLLIVACKKSEPPQSPAPEVEVVQVQQKDVPISREWVGTLDGTANAQIRSQVIGYLLRRNYTEGSYVRKGQLLFEIDPRTFQAALDQVKAESDGVWAPHWYAAVWASTGFEPWRPREVALSDHDAAVAAACRPVYDALYARRLRI